ncbi:MAG: amylo-alpha-1,6-glucosidase [Bacteroidia bacterium]|nr:amylo-alpha-1,6-glucosidase [Bacteroidia bacterium]
MQIKLGPSVLHRFDHAIQHEWLETNGLGGYSSSTVLGTNTRRYHGLLVAALKPPVGRVVLLSKMDDSIWLNGQKYDLHTNKYQGAVNPHGYIFLQKFEQNLFPTFYYQINGVSLRKSIVAIHGENTVIVRYEVLEASSPFTLELTPLTMPRDYHCLGKENYELNQVVSQHESTLYLQPYHHLTPIYISAEGMHFDYEPFWHYNFEYTEELNRGMEAHEDLFSPGKIFVDLQEGQHVDVVISTQNIPSSKGADLIQRERLRRLTIMNQAPTAHPMIQKLTLAADQFIVKRGEDLKTIIAGYHWFTDWGRDTMISLPGLCLTTGRYDDAKKILKAFTYSTSQGMLPNRFPDDGEEPMYNTIDATLWFFVAVYKYALESRDYQFVLQEILPVMEDILNWHKRGTRYNIRMDKDGLLTGGTDGEMLTWMDARAGDWVVTPRIGKSVEINALWYNAWRIFDYFLKVKGDESMADQASRIAQKVKHSFQQQFWYEEGKYLYDFIHGEEKNADFRPNQLFAISLPFTLIRHEQAQSVLAKAEKELFTPVGLRSLSNLDPQYKGIYLGDQYARDGAYHQGTTWSWLMGPYLDALIKVRSTWGRDEAVSIIENMYNHMANAGMGHISEIFDGNAPFTPRGCVAQAWGVAEILRVVHEYQLYGPELELVEEEAARRQEGLKEQVLVR